MKIIGGHKMYADLHIHSNYSDGTNTPKELIEIAKRNNVSTLALSDHDSVDGIREALKEAAINGIKVIPAVELSTSIDGVRIHILGYNIDCNNHNLKKYLKSMSDARTQNTKLVLEKLNMLRLLDYSWRDVEKHKAYKSWICSLDVFEAMRLDGLFQHRSEWKEFYYRYFSKNSPAYMDMEGFTSKSAIEAVLDAGGVPVVAHPKLIGNDAQLDYLVRYGLRGIEVYYPAHNDGERTKYNEFAKKNNLVVTGGTDWHGDFTEWNVNLGDCGIDMEKLFLLENG
jgi:predicted metal-dependent phosphoesterase TrpH